MHRRAIAPVVKVAVEVYQSGSNQLSRHIYGRGGRRGVYAICHLGHQTVLECNVPAVVDTLSRV
jgi:hypothetical protein